MIFVTVGTQLAFDRMISTVDDWCKINSETEVFAQIGPTELEVHHMQHQKFTTPQKANELFLNAELVVAHAGMGSVLTSLKYRKPLIIMPRKASLGEHRNDHQMATAKWLANRGGITVAWDEAELINLLNNRHSMTEAETISEYASPMLIEKLKEYFNAI